MMILGAEVNFAMMDKLRERMDRLESQPHSPDSSEWQETRLLIRALTERVARWKNSTEPVLRKIRVDAPEAVSGDWQELVETLRKGGAKPQPRKRS